MFDEELDLDHFFSKGYATRHLKKDVADSLITFLQTENFVTATDIFDVYDSKKYESSVGEVIEPNFNVNLKRALQEDWKGVEHPEIWDKGVNGPFTKANPFNEYPEKLKNFWRDVEAETSWFTQIYGNFTHRYMLAHRYKQNQSLGWHHDLSDSTWLNNILYLGDSDFTLEDGGYLSIAECDIDDEGLPVEIVKVLGNVLPNHGTLVLMDNMNPRLLHKVFPLNSNKFRFTLSCQFGYIDNILGKTTNKSF